MMMNVVKVMVVIGMRSRNKERGRRERRRRGNKRIEMGRERKA